MIRSIQLAVFAILFTFVASRGPMASTAAVKSPAFDKYTQKIADTDVTFDMVPIPGGTFKMGSPENEKGRSEHEGPQFTAEVKPFWMGKCEVTWEEFEIFLDEMGVEDRDENKRRRGDKADALTGPTPPYVSKYYGHGQKGFPAITMTHHCAWEYCRWLSIKTGKPYRLPTEAEWEYAARAGTTTAYFFGDDASKLGEYAWYAKNSPDLELKPDKTKGTTHAIGTRKPNPWGLHDIYGNVMEWTIDHYNKDAYSLFAKQKQPLLQPFVIAADRKWSHVARGGTWADPAEALRSAARRPSDPSWMKHDPQEPQSIWWLTKFDVVGIRVVRPVEEQQNLKGARSKVVEDTSE